MRTDDFLAGLDLHQLYYAREAADARIKEKEREQKLLVWSVDDREVALEYFGTDEYMKAVEYLAATARERFSAGRDEAGIKQSESTEQKPLTQAAEVNPELQTVFDVLSDTADMLAAR